MRETEVSLVEDDKIREASPLWWCIDELGERLLEECRRKTIAEHCRVSEQCAVGWRKSVDASCHEVLECGGYGVEGSEFASSMGELEQEQRVTPCSGAEFLEFALRDLSVVGQRRREMLCELTVKRSEVEQTCFETEPGTEPDSAVSRCQTDEPRQAMNPLQRSGDQLCGCLVHPHRVFDDKDERVGERCVQDGRCRVAEHTDAIRGAELVDRRRGRNFGIDGCRQERGERPPLRGVRLQPSGEQRTRLRRRRVKPDTERSSQDQASDEVRAVDGERLAGESHHANGSG